MPDSAKYKKPQTQTMAFHIDSQRTEEAAFSRGESVLDVALNNGVDLSHSCGGMGTCGTCRIVVLKGAEGLASPNEVEAEMAQERGLGRNERLACQIAATSGLHVRIPTSD